ncbi:lymphocyte function-associated antigen 3 [Phacochoerus africanus]|uniref:lymphocyte function-associated antigen 3 n=1 Tax=Phacochoerus africanus TaxID=41426 RepID=UPI001FDA001F|nr:lymphocyte function-associated antigen 3 [Phacochoerus africanus]
MASGRALRWAVRAPGVIFLLLWLDFIPCDSQVIYGALHKNVTLYASSSQTFQEIIWKKGKDKAVEWEEQYNVKAFPPFVDRVHLNTGSGDLTIYNLAVEDEGDYQIESPSVKNSSKLILKVVEPLPEPELYCESTEGNISVRCLILEPSLRHMDLIQYSWNCPPTVSCQAGLGPSEMYITKESDFSQDVQCIISNPLFKSSASTSLSSCAPTDNTRHRYVLVAVLPVVIVALVLLKWFLARRSG